MSNAHTPGPWTVSRGGWDDNAHACYSLEGVKEVRVADARLIAAAPELLAALQSLLDMDVAYQRGPVVVEAVEIARAAIKKATEASNA